MIDRSGIVNSDTHNENASAPRELSAEELRFVCRVVGLTGTQGVLIPASNVRHLILRRDVVKAVADGKFHIYPVKTIDEGIAILTGRFANGSDETINDAVAQRLKELAVGLKEFAVSEKIDTSDSKQ